MEKNKMDEIFKTIAKIEMIRNQAIRCVENVKKNDSNFGKPNSPFGEIEKTILSATYSQEHMEGILCSLGALLNSVEDVFEMEPNLTAKELGGLIYGTLRMVAQTYDFIYGANSKTTEPEELRELKESTREKIKELIKKDSEQKMTEMLKQFDGDGHVN